MTRGWIRVQTQPAMEPTKRCSKSRRTSWPMRLRRWTRTAVFVAGYLTVALLVFMIFVALRRHFGPKLVGSTMFGSSEYYLGMISGAIRYACMMLTALALLNAPIYTAAEIQAKKAYNNRWFGGGMKDYKGDFFPTLDEVQASVYKVSLTGPLIRDNLTILLINSAPPVKARPAKIILQP